MQLCRPRRCRASACWRDVRRIPLAHLHSGSGSEARPGCRSRASGPSTCPRTAAAPLSEHLSHAFRTDFPSFFIFLFVVNVRSSYERFASFFIHFHIICTHIRIGFLVGMSWRFPALFSGSPRRAPAGRSRWPPGGSPGPAAARARRARWRCQRCSPPEIDIKHLFIEEEDIAVY